MTKYTKVCSMCKEDKPLNEFYNSITFKDGKAYRCKTCDNEAGARYRKKHRERYLRKQRDRNRKSKYGITKERFKELKEEQLMLCAICKVRLEENNTNKHTSSTLCIDHCHTTGKVRGLLCTRCNKGLGMFDDSVEAMTEAIKYLSKT